MRRVFLLFFLAVASAAVGIGSIVVLDTFGGDLPKVISFPMVVLATVLPITSVLGASVFGAILLVFAGEALCKKR